MKIMDDYGNIIAQRVERPAVLSEFFKCSNKIDVHIQNWQSSLNLEKCWLTQYVYSCLFTALVAVILFLGINIVGTYHLCKYYSIIHYRLLKEGSEKITTQKIA